MKQLYIILLTLAVGVFSACKNDNDTLVAFGPDETELVFAADGGTACITLNSDEGWSVSSDCEWCFVTPTNGSGTTTCDVRVDSSYLYSAREAHLNFRSGSMSRQLVVRQFGYEKVIELDKTEIEVPDFTDYDALFEEVKVTSNISYDISIEYANPSHTDWLSVSKPETNVKSVPRPATVRIDYKMYMESDADRVATVIFRQNDAKAGETPVESRLTFRQTHAQPIIPSREGDSLALLAVSRIMHTSNAWDTSQPMIHWNNVQMDNVTYYNAKLQKTITEPRVTKLSVAMFDTDGDIPYQIAYLDQLRELYFTANANAHLRRIPLGDAVCKLPHLKVLDLVGYGITSLPEAMKDMVNLEELELSGNNFTEIPLDILTALDKHKLWYFNMANNRRRDVFARLYDNAEVRDTLGLHGVLPEALFNLKNIRYIGLSYNYLEGSIPDMGYDASQYATLQEKMAHNPVMPQLEQLSVNLNYITGELPDWILYHPNLRCWDPYTLVFNQYEGAHDSKGRKVGFSNEPALIEQNCTLWSSDDEDNTQAFTRARTFDSSIKYDMLRHGTVYR